MNVGVDYSREVRGHLSLYPVWQPGEDVSPGDIGELVDGVFYPQGKIGELFPDLRLRKRRTNRSNQLSFYSQGVNLSKLNASGDSSVIGAAMVDGSATIQFSRSGAVVFHAADCTRRYIENLRAIRETIEDRSDDWPSGAVLVSHVEDAKAFHVAVAGGKDGMLALKGNLEPLQNLKIADAKISVGTEKNIAYRRTGSGPVLLRLYGFGFWGRLAGTKLLSRDHKSEADEKISFGELSARDAINSQGSSQ